MLLGDPLKILYVTGFYISPCVHIPVTGVCYTLMGAEKLRPLSKAELPKV